jgi:hypothetical protein
VLRVAALLPIALALLVGTARADGDPASDVLYFQDVFLPYPAPSPAAGQRLTAAVAESKGVHSPVKVAVIANSTDLGSIPSLFGRPQLYAQFLGTEIKPFFTHRLLVVMPSGFGVYENGRSTAPALHALRGLTRGSTPDALVGAATAAVRRLTAVPQAVKRDHTPPRAVALPASVVSGHTVSLRYRVTDDSGKARAVVRVYWAQNLLYASIETPYRTAKGALQSTSWRTPPGLSGRKFRFCVLASDHAGNVGIPGCAPLRIH